MLLYIGLLNILLSILLVAYNWRSNRNTIFLGVMLLTISTYILGYHLLVTGESRFWLAVIWGNFSPIWYLGGPCLYLYVRGTLEDRFDLRRADLFHLIPFALTLVGSLQYILTPFEHKLQVADAIIRDLTVARNMQTNRLLPVNPGLLVRPTLLIIYSLASLRLVMQYASRNAHSRSIPREQWKMVRNWILTLSGTLLAASMIALAMSAFYSSDPQVDRQMVNQNIIRQISGYVLALMPITFMLFPQILYGIPIYRKPRHIPETPETEDKSAEKVGIEEDHSAKSTNPNYALGERPMEDPFKELGERIIQVMEEQKPYTNPDFSLDDLAKMLDVPKHHLYYCFRNILNTKFTQLRMDYRIECAKKLLTEANLSIITIDAVGKDSGFASKSGFYNTFKAEVGCSPGEYAEKLNSQKTNT